MNSISHKVSLGYLLVLVVAVVTSVALFGAASGVEERTRHYVELTLPELDALQQVQQSLDAMHIAAYGLYGTTLNAADFSRMTDNAEQRMSPLLQAGGVLKAYSGRQPLVQSLSQLRQLMSQLQEVMVADSVDWDAARELLARLDQQSNVLSEQLDKLKRRVSSAAASSSKMIASDIGNIRQWVLALLVCIVLVALLAFWISRKTIALPMRELSSELEQAAEHYDLSALVPVRTRDEISKTASSINRLLQAFNRGITDVRGAVDSISGLVGVLAHSSVAADQQVQRLNDKIESLTSEMRALEQQIEQGCEHSQQASEKAKDSAVAVRGGADNVAQTSSGIAALARDIETSSEMLLALRNSGDQVSSVVGTIAEIAEQTNLLALNAAIEAARAGESGRGFAVVADEVRTLANRTRQSTAEINSMLETIVSSISQAVTSMESNQTQAGQAVELAQTTVESLSSIQSNILTLSDDSQQVASMAEQSCNQVVEMRAAVEDFKAVGDSVVQSSIETRETSNKMTELAASLEQSVGRFRT